MPTSLTTCPTPWPTSSPQWSSSLEDSPQDVIEPVNAAAQQIMSRDDQLFAATGIKVAHLKLDAFSGPFDLERADLVAFIKGLAGDRGFKLALPRADRTTRQMEKVVRFFCSRSKAVRRSQIEHGCPSEIVYKSNSKQNVFSLQMMKEFHNHELEIHNLGDLNEEKGERHNWNWLDPEGKIHKR